MRLKEGAKIFIIADLSDLIADYFLQIVCRYTVGCLQMICILFAGYLLISSHATVSNSYLGFLSHFHSISVLKKTRDKWMDGRMERWTDRWMDGETDGQRDRPMDGQTLIQRCVGASKSVTSSGLREV